MPGVGQLAISDAPNIDRSLGNCHYVVTTTTLHTRATMAESMIVSHCSGLLFRFLITDNHSWLNIAFRTLTFKGFKSVNVYFLL